ncbi:unnamed protein product, partial [Protopolystoma xenopodis]
MPAVYFWRYFDIMNHFIYNCRNERGHKIQFCLKLPPEERQRLQDQMTNQRLYTLGTGGTITPGVTPSLSSSGQLSTMPSGLNKPIVSTHLFPHQTNTSTVFSTGLDRLRTVVASPSPGVSANVNAAFVPGHTGFVLASGHLTGAGG